METRLALRSPHSKQPPAWFTLGTPKEKSGVGARPSRDHLRRKSKERPNGKMVNGQIVNDLMGKVFFDPGIESVRGILIGTDPYYLRRYPARDGGVMHIVQARPDRSGHTPSEAEAANRSAFGLAYGKERHREFIERTMKGQLEIEFTD